MAHLLSFPTIHLPALPEEVLVSLSLPAAIIRPFEISLDT